MGRNAPTVFLIVANVLFAAPVRAAAPAADKSPKSHALVIQPDKDSPWGGELADVQKVLDSAGRQLWRHFPGRELAPIAVQPKGGPIVLYERGKQGEYRVRLDTGERRWAQHAYQFAHELCHILSNYQEDPHRQKWFEEAVCELASIYVLRQMADEWKERPPYRNWRDYSKSLAEYADGRIKLGKLPEGTTLAKWYADNAAALGKTATDRDRNSIVAVALLPLFEKQPGGWAAIAYLNTGKPHGSQTLAEYFAEWHDKTPARHQPLVRDIAKLFEIELPGERGASAP